MTQTVVGIFDTPDAARSAEETLISRGLDRSAFHLTAAEAHSSTYGQTQREEHKGGIRQFFSDLFGTGESKEAEYYSEAIRRGGVMLAVDVPDDADIEPVRDALESAGAVDIEERADYWRKQGWSGYDPQSRPYTAEEAAKERSTVVPVIEEQLEVGKRQVNKGVVRVFSRTVETPVHEDVTLREEHATIERHTTDRAATPEEMANFGNKSIEVQETAEKAVVNKTARVVEEVVVDKEVSQRTETVDDTVRHTEVETERSGGEASTSRRSYEDYERDYRQDFQTRYGSTGGRYEDYEPAYRYGHNLGTTRSYQDRPWQEIEPQAQRDWERQHPGTWERVKASVQHGWERVTGKR